jgi:prevent-host-death family protein
MEVDMRTIGVRELKEHASKVLRRVRERGEEIEVTHHGRVIARLIPVSRERPRPRASAAAWSTLDRVAKDIGARWPKGRSAAQAVRKGRREL